MKQATLDLARLTAGLALFGAGAAGMAVWSLTIDTTLGRFPGHFVNPTLRTIGRGVMFLPAVPAFGMAVLGHALIEGSNHRNDSILI